MSRYVKDLQTVSPLNNWLLYVDRRIKRTGSNDNHSNHRDSEVTLSPPLACASSQHRFVDKINVGDSIWLAGHVRYADLTLPLTLVAKIVVEDIGSRERMIREQRLPSYFLPSFDSKKRDWSKYVAIGKKSTSRYFPWNNFSKYLIENKLLDGAPITKNGNLGQNLQTIRKFSDAKTSLLDAYVEKQWIVRRYF